MRKAKLMIFVILLSGVLMLLITRIKIVVVILIRAKLLVVSLCFRPASMNVEVVRANCFVPPIHKKYSDIYNLLVRNSAVDTARKLESTNQTLLLQLKKASTASSTILCVCPASVSL